MTSSRAEPLLLGDPGELVSAARDAGWNHGVAAAENDLPETDGPRAALIARDSPNTAAGDIARLRHDADLVLIDASSGGATAYVRNDKVDGITGLAGERFLDRELLRAAADNGVALVFDLSPVIHGRNRFRAMKRLVANAETCRDTGCPAMLTAGATTAYGVRAPRELAALARLSGFTTDQARDALELPGRRLRRG